MSAQDFIVWVDTETTGIEADQNLLLELAIVITDNNLNVIEEASYILDHNIDDVVAKCNDYVTKMHTSNGLLADIASDKVAKISLAELDSTLVELLAKHDIEAKALLAGNSIHFDRSYIKEYLSRFNSKLNYRMLDVSAIDLAAERGILKLTKPAKAYGHRALDDIHESIKELKAYSGK